MGIEEREEMQTADINNLSNKIIAENFPILEKKRSSRCSKFTEHKHSGSKKKYP
jgi:hypothetical protein